MTGWGNSGPLALAAFAVPTFMLSAINVGWVNEGVTPIVFAVALMSGGIVQLIAGIIQLRTGNTIAGVLFSMYGALWLSLFAFAQFFASEVPPAERGHALGLLLFAFGVFTLWIFVASFRTNAVVVTALVFLAATLFVLGSGKYAANVDLIRAGGWLGFIAGTGRLPVLRRAVPDRVQTRGAAHLVAGQIASRAQWRDSPRLSRGLSPLAKDGPKADCYFSAVAPRRLRR